jgi:hypothetical protein
MAPPRVAPNNLAQWLKHLNQTFENEYIGLLTRHEIDHDQRYVFD